MLVEHANAAKFEPPLSAANYPRVVSRNTKPYKTEDGYVAALVYNDQHWNLFMEAVKPAWASDEFATLQQRARQIDHVYSLLSEAFQERTTGEWLALLRELNIPAAPFRSTDELFDNSHLDAVNFFETVDTAQGSVRFPGIPTSFSKTPGKIRASAPDLGAHTAEVLTEFGLPSLGDEAAPQ